jgi:threonine dehydrogenase-like Zn-dependent dehydrogenase
MPTHCPNRTSLAIFNRDGAFAEYLTLLIENLHLVPDDVSDEEAVFVESLADNTDLEASVCVNPPENARQTFDLVVNGLFHYGSPSPSPSTLC